MKKGWLNLVLSQLSQSWKPQSNLETLESGNGAALIAQKIINQKQQSKLAIKLNIS